MATDGLMDCSICFSLWVFPLQLKCGHIYCYLCVKGLLNSSQSSRCPLCRKWISKNVLKRPKFVNNGLHSDRADFSGQQWFYEGNHGSGFWAYDYFNGTVLEEAYNSDKKMCELIISGVEYCVDFVQQIQYRKDCPSKKRKIKRDLLSNIEIFKGIAGVSKHLVRDVSQNIDSTLNFGQQMAINLANNSVESNEETEEQIRKRIKVEIKEEPTEEPDSTSV